VVLRLAGDFVANGLVQREHEALARHPGFAVYREGAFNRTLASRRAAILACSPSPSGDQTRAASPQRWTRDCKVRASNLASTQRRLPRQRRNGFSALPKIMARGLRREREREILTECR
jgi:hypothetical protein